MNDEYNRTPTALHRARTVVDRAACNIDQIRWKMGDKLNKKFPGEQPIKLNVFMLRLLMDASAEKERNLWRIADALLQAFGPGEAPNSYVNRTHREYPESIDEMFFENEPEMLVIEAILDAYDERLTRGANAPLDQRLLHVLARLRWAARGHPPGKRRPWLVPRY